MPDGITIETVDLSARGIVLPSDRVGMVIAQPHVPDNSFTATEPYQCIDQVKTQRLAMLQKTLAIAQARPHGVSKTHFTIFPEYTIPGLEGVQLIEDILNDASWPNGTMVIGGTDALTHTQYAQLLQGRATHVNKVRNGIAQVTGDQWVNCAIIWVKSDAGILERWIQPKMHPAWEEMDVSYQHMFQGRSLFIFKGQLNNGVPYRFGALICFDWIATVEAKKSYRWILEELQHQAAGGQLPLSWLFIIQRNKKPSHLTFLSEIGVFFNQTECPNALRDRTCLVFANTAGKANPGRTNEFGASSVVFSNLCGFAKPTSVPTFSAGGPKFRDGSDLLSYYKDMFFRERGACVHSFAQINPVSLTAGPGGRSLAVENAHVFPIIGEPESRAPSAAVPADVKWLNDELDDLPSLSAQYSTAALAENVDGSHKQIVEAFRTALPSACTKIVKLAAQKSEPAHADDWGDIELEALEHVVHTLEIFGVACAFQTVGSGSLHATLSIRNKMVNLVAIRGVTHAHCIEHSKKFVSSPAHQVLLISRDEDNTAWDPRFGSILEQQSKTLGQERKITDPASGSLHIGYAQLLTMFRTSATPVAIEGAINAELTK
jgi:hypothetical protein